MKNLTFLISIILFASCADNSTIGKYTKEKLPDDFSYKVIKDESDPAFEKNQITIEINQKISNGQIATLADKLFSSKPKQRRFYMFYIVSGMKVGSGAWATSHFDPEIEIMILGATEQEEEMLDNVTIESGEIIGKWKEVDPVMSCTWIIFLEGDQYKIKAVYMDGSQSTEILSKSNYDNLIRFDYSDNEFGEYLLIEKNGNLGIYDTDGKISESKKVE